MMSPGTKVSLGTFSHSVELYYPFLSTSTSQIYLAIPRIVSLLALVSLTVEKFETNARNKMHAP